MRNAASCFVTPASCSARLTSSPMTGRRSASSLRRPSPSARSIWGCTSARRFATFGFMTSRSSLLPHGCQAFQFAREVLAHAFATPRLAANPRLVLREQKRALGVERVEPFHAEPEDLGHLGGEEPLGIRVERPRRLVAHGATASE